MAYPRWSILILIAVCVFLFFYRLADRDLWSSHEGRAAQNAQSMLSDGDWRLPKLFDGQIDMQKPPFYYWLVAVFGWLRGAVDAWAVRLPASLAATATVLWVFAIGWMGKRRSAGFLAAIMLATMLHFTWLARTGRIDMVLCFTISLALGSFYLARNASNAARCHWLLIGYLAISVSILLKGPIALVLPLAVAGIYLLCEKEIPSPLRWKAWGKLLHHYGLWWGVPLVAALSLPWFLWADHATGGAFSHEFFWRHNVERGLGGSSTLASYPLWYYVPRLFVDLLPWSVLLPVAVWVYARSNWRRKDALARFSLTWFLTVVGMLSLSQFKRADYLLPAYPGAALFLGISLDRWLQQHEWKRRWVYSFAAVILVYALGWWAYVSYVLPQQEPHREQIRFAELIRTYEPRPMPIIFFRVEDHALAFHVGRPIDTILEWENIDVWVSRPGTRYIVMTPEAARDWPLYITSGRLVEVARNTDITGEHVSPLVLLRTCNGSSHPP